MFEDPPTEPSPQQRQRIILFIGSTRMILSRCCIPTNFIAASTFREVQVSIRLSLGRRLTKGISLVASLLAHWLVSLRQRKRKIFVIGAIQYYQPLTGLLIAKPIIHQAWISAFGSSRPGSSALAVNLCTPARTDGIVGMYPKIRIHEADSDCIAYSMAIWDS